jgi:predicted acylesterase/phospholipase RssA
MAPDPQSPARAEPAAEELRIAIALNGGVSLAVWMGGCAVELDRARRANRQAEDGREAYDALCACFDRRLVIDILSGASAGGINGALLSAAMVKGRRLSPDFIRNRWLELGDLSKILHDPQDPEPTSLMDGKTFHEGLLTSFQELEGEPGALGPNERPLASVPSLDVTMTDVNGVKRRFKDAWGNDLCALEHRPRFQFREEVDFSAEALAEAGRTSASFPVAFEPWRVEGAFGLADLPGPTFGIDGGLLDNAPIRAALELIPLKPASSRVRRYVCYLNGDPATFSRKAGDGQPPSLRQVGGYVVSLPRVAPFVDQLYAIERAVERPTLVDKVQLPLLELPIAELQGVAAALLPAYQQRRRRASLEELSADPAEVRSMEGVLDGDGGNLPWIPTGLAPATGERWGWGTRAAQRILHLLLDLLRPAIQNASSERRGALLEQRVAIDGALDSLSTAHGKVTSAPSANDSGLPPATISARLAAAMETAAEVDPQTHREVKAGVAAFAAALSADPGLFPEGLGALLFGWKPEGPAVLSGEAFERFLRRVLCIEVVRRALAEDADIESSQSLQFVQLTPTAPAPIFAYPTHPSGPASAEAKLTGVGLGHFAGFYRRSWRANDFMWGRLDAAARIVELLLDSPPSGPPTERGPSLATALLGPAPDEQRDWLIDEALAEAGHAETLAGKDEEERLALIAGVIEAELAPAADPQAQPRFTRAAFQRMAQLEIAREELPIIRRESKQDRALGSAAKELKLGGAKPTTRAEIEAVRAIYQQGHGSLPKQLSDGGEAVSDLGLRTITRASFVGLAAVRTAGMPLAKFFGLVRAPLLAVAGSVAQSWLYRATAMLGFWAAAAFLTSRLVTTEATPPAFSDAWSLATLAALAAVLGALGIAAVPGLRAWRGPKRLENGAWAVALAGFAFLFATALAAIFGKLDLTQILFAPGAKEPSKWSLLAVLAAIGVVSLARLSLPRPLGWLAERARGKGALCAVLSAAFLLLGYEAADGLIAGFGDGLWQGFSVGFAVVAAPLAAALQLSLARLRN